MTPVCGPVLAPRVAQLWPSPGPVVALRVARLRPRCGPVVVQWWLGCGLILA